MSLDAGTATEMVKGLDPNVVQELALEAAYLDSAGYRKSKHTTRTVREFCDSLSSDSPFHLQSFLQETLTRNVGKEKAEQIKNQIQQALQKRDPFIPIRTAEPRKLASVLENQHPQAVAVVLSELDAMKSSEVLGFLGDGVRLSAISRMTARDSATAEAKTRIAETVSKYLETVEAPPVLLPRIQPKQSLRKVAVILRNMGTELRDNLLASMQTENQAAAEMVTKLMVLWEDIPHVADRSLQKALRGIDSRKLALSLVNADEETAAKIRSNISARTAAAIDEELSLMSGPLKEETDKARNSIIEALREMNDRRELKFMEE